MPPWQVTGKVEGLGGRRDRERAAAVEFLAQQLFACVIQTLQQDGSKIQTPLSKCAVDVKRGVETASTPRKSCCKRCLLGQQVTFNRSPVLFRVCYSSPTATYPLPPVVKPSFTLQKFLPLAFQLSLAVPRRRNDKIRREGLELQSSRSFFIKCILVVNI